MSIFLIAIIAVQAAFVTHLFRSRGRLYWLPVIICPPGLGCVAYFFTQILPVVYPIPQK
jgi:hypothetical protein